MRFGRCSSCGEYKHLISDAECNSCSDQEIRSTREVPEIPDCMKEFVPENEFDCIEVQYLGEEWYAQDAIYSEVNDMWLLEIYNGMDDREFVIDENVKNHVELAEDN
jgi:hypothetical protein